MMIRVLSYLLAAAGIGLLALVLFRGDEQESGQGASGSGDAITYSRGRQMNLGALLPGEHRVSFGVHNRGDREVEVKDVSSSCDCVDVALARGPLPPGEHRECAVLLKVKAGGPRAALVSIRYGPPLSRTDDVMLYFEAANRWQLVPDRAEVVVDGVMPGARIAERLTVSMRGNHGIGTCPMWRWILVPPKIAAETRASVRETEEGLAFDLEFEISPLGPGERSSGGIVLEVGNPPEATLSVPLRISTAPGFQVTPQFVTATVVPGTKLPHQLSELSISLPETWAVADVAGPNWLDVTIREGSAGNRVLLALSRPLVKGLLAGSVRIDVRRETSAQSAILEVPVSVQEGR